MFMRFFPANLAILILLTLFHSSELIGVEPQKDTIRVFETGSAPVFDGYDDDTCWSGLEWQAIDQVWIPWNNVIDTDDFSGQYKIAWSSEENLLYFLLKVTDDISSTGYQPGISSEIFNFDMFEVFIDEDRSGGYHVFDAGGENDDELGINAENAFAYHIFTHLPAHGEKSLSFIVEDLSGPNWDHLIVCDYRHHFPNFVCRRNGTTLTWEFSLKVFDASYSEDAPEASRVLLNPGKAMGITLACNDDDDPNTDPANARRDTFIGSTKVCEAASNDHWKKADDFGIHLLCGRNHDR